MSSTSFQQDQKKIRILILNPNSSQSMTEGMKKAISSLNLPDTIKIDYYTAPTGPASINDGDDVQKSAQEVLKDLSPNGIFEAATLTSLSLLTGPTKKWGIVTTGKFWEDHLITGVHEFLGYAADGEEGYPKNWKFAGVQTTGLNAGDFHGDIPQEEIDDRLVEATKKLLQAGDVECVVMGCAGMAGLEQIIRRTAIEEYGEERGKKVMVVDGVRAGVGLLAEMVKNRRMFTQ
ncbi:unnamed protein product [Sordaria macrospora k-hell]|uniref:WGS project CABT00000000 data, contig 2.38 n=2 Tax=Sordaria macrospora TaxID=5147 RepID=F7W7D6_SORMK|nr:uncharacterized protein SMAC_06924 [Sordaria macrospora k-hell]CCC13427.1 unnamed protein product [Sordaria macrospora k-hell]